MKKKKNIILEYWKEENRDIMEKIFFIYGKFVKNENQRRKKI